MAFLAASIAYKKQTEIIKSNSNQIQYKVPRIQLHLRNYLQSKYERVLRRTMREPLSARFKNAF